MTTPAARSSPLPEGEAASSSQHASWVESIHLAVGVLGALAGALVGVHALRGTTPLAESGSIGQVAVMAVVGCATATSAVVLVTRTLAALPWYGA